MTNSVQTKQALASELPSDNPSDSETADRLKKSRSTLYRVFRTPVMAIQTLLAPAQMSRMDGKRLFMLYLLPALFLHLVWMMPDYLGFFWSDESNSSITGSVVMVLGDALMIPSLLVGLFFCLYPLVLHRVQFLFAGCASEKEIRAGFGFSALWLYLGMIMILPVFYLYQIAPTDWWLVLVVIVNIVCLLVHICMMATVLKLSFVSTVFSLIISYVLPLTFVYALNLVMTDILVGIVRAL